MSAPQMAFPLFTSIPPNSNYRPFIENWQSSGFRVISVNNHEESSSLRGVETITVESNEKKLPISIILRAIKDSGVPFAGLINADCKFITRFDGAALEREVASSIILAERIDVDGKGSPITYRAHGFDAMLFDTSFIRQLKINSAFRMGEPWWDYWLPYAFQAAGSKIKKFDCPVLTHAYHTPIWNGDSHVRLAQLFSAEFERFRTIHDGGKTAYQGLLSSPAIQSGIPEVAAQLLSGIPGLVVAAMSQQHYTARFIERLVAPNLAGRFLAKVRRSLY
jgi:hypothetical protein